MRARVLAIPALAILLFSAVGGIPTASSSEHSRAMAFQEAISSASALQPGPKSRLQRRALNNLSERVAYSLRSSGGLSGLFSALHPQNIRNKAEFTWVTAKPKVREPFAAIARAEVPRPLRSWNLFKDGASLREKVRAGNTHLVRMLDKVRPPSRQYRYMRKEWKYEPDLRRHYFFPRVLRVPVIIQESELPYDKEVDNFTKGNDDEFGHRSLVLSHLPKFAAKFSDKPETVEVTLAKDAHATVESSESPLSDRVAVTASQDGLKRSSTSENRPGDSRHQAMGQMPTGSDLLNDQLRKAQRDKLARSNARKLKSHVVPLANYFGTPERVATHDVFEQESSPRGMDAWGGEKLVDSSGRELSEGDSSPLHLSRWNMPHLVPTPHHTPHLTPHTSPVHTLSDSESDFATAHAVSTRSSLQSLVAPHTMNGIEGRIKPVADLNSESKASVSAHSQDQEEEVSKSPASTLGAKGGDAMKVAFNFHTTLMEMRHRFNGFLEYQRSQIHKASLRYPGHPEHENNIRSPLTSGVATPLKHGDQAATEIAGNGMDVSQKSPSLSTDPRSTWPDTNLWDKWDQAGHSQPYPQYRPSTGSTIVEGTTPEGQRTPTGGSDADTFTPLESPRPSGFSGTSPISRYTPQAARDIYQLDSDDDRIKKKFVPSHYPDVLFAFYRDLDPSGRRSSSVVESRTGLLNTQRSPKAPQSQMISSDDKDHERSTAPTPNTSPQHWTSNRNILPPVSRMSEYPKSPLVTGESSTSSDDAAPVVAAVRGGRKPDFRRFGSRLNPVGVPSPQDHLERTAAYYRSYSNRKGRGTARHVTFSPVKPSDNDRSPQLPSRGSFAFGAPSPGLDFPTPRMPEKSGARIAANVAFNTQTETKPPIFDSIFSDSDHNPDRQLATDTKQSFRP